MNQETPNNWLFVSDIDSYEEGESISGIVTLHNLATSESGEYREERNIACLTENINQERT
jgi:hypothetical protein